MNVCPAGKHDMDKVGTKRRYDRGPDAKPNCRGCLNQEQRERRAAIKAAANEDWRLAEVYDLDTDQLIVDEIAIERAVTGERGEGAWITRTEAIEAFRIMDARGYEYSQIAENIGCDQRTIERWASGETGKPASQVKPVRQRSLTPDQLDAKRARDKARMAALRAVVVNAA